MPAGFVVGDRGLGAAGDTHPAWMMAHATAGPFLIVGASAIGQMHLAKNRPRDDAFLIRSVGPWLAAAVSDGVGSRKHSRYGATYAVESLTSWLLRPFTPPLDIAAPSHAASPEPAKAIPPDTVEEADFQVAVLDKGAGAAELAAGLLQWSRKTVAGLDVPLIREYPVPSLRQTGSTGWSWSDSGRESEPRGDVPTTAIVQQAFQKTHLGLRQQAQSLDLELQDVSCTGLALLVNLETRVGAVGQLGDGAILALTDQGEVKELGAAPETGDPQSTYSLSDPNLNEHLGCQVIGPEEGRSFAAFYLMTDGVAGDLLYTSELDVAHWTRGMERNLHLSTSPAQASAGLLKLLATYQVKGSWDDRTLVVISNAEQWNGNGQSTSE